jgi:hypothetical protein
LVSARQRRTPTVLVPDSDPPNSSQRPTQVRHSSPWDCEDDLNSEHDVSYSPERAGNSPTKSKRQHSPTLSLPTLSILDATHDESMDSQTIEPVTGNTKQQSSSGRGDSQNSAAASLPSPPPEGSKGQKTVMQNLETVLGRRADEPISLSSILAHSRDTTLQRTSKNGPNEQQEEPFETGLVDVPSSRKRRLSQSQLGDTPNVQFSKELASSVDERPAFENKRRRLDSPQSKSAPHQLKVTREGLANEPTLSSSMTKPTVSNSGPGDIIPHDHDAWANPSWMNDVPILQKAEVPNPLRTADVRYMDKLHSQRVPQPGTKLRTSHPPLHHPTRTAQHVRSPEHPPITPSQFADADEDSLAPMVNPRARLSAAIPPAHKPVASASRTRNIATLRCQRVVSAPGPSKQLRTSGRNRDNPGATQESDQTARYGGRASEGQQIEEKNRRLTLPTPDNRRRNSKVHFDDSSINTVQSAITARQPYLGEFHPSTMVDLPRKYQWTWENWLEVTKDAYSFWLD